MKIEINKKVLLVDILASLYIGIVVTLSITDEISKFWIFIPITLFFVILLYYAFYIQKVGACFRIEKERNEPKRLTLAVVICGGIVLLGQLFYWLAYFPGGFNLDAYGHWDQVHGYAQLNDWHSVVVTGIYWLLTRINDSIEFCIGVQIVLFSISYALLLRELGRCEIPRKLLYFATIFVAIIPSVGMNNICIIKDVYFTVCLIWIYIFILRLSKANEINKRVIGTVAGMVMLLILITLIRHNGILIVLPIFLFLFVQFKKNKMVLVGSVIVFVLSIAFIYGPVFKIINIEKHSNIVGETTGVLMASMTNAYLKEPNQVPDDVKIFLESIADREEYEAHYILGEWDSCRWDFGGAELLQDEDFIKIVKYAVMTAINCPQSVYESVKENTSIVWQVVGDVDWEPWVYIEEPNQYGISEKPVSAIRTMEIKISELSHSIIGCIGVWNIGSYIMIIVVLSVYLAVNNQCKKMLYAFPLIIYAWGTMLLLSGPNQRYFYYFQVMILPVLYIILQEKGFEKNE